MDDDILLKISLVSACIGLFSMFIVQSIAELPEYNVSEVKDAKENKDLYVNGKVTGFYEGEKSASIRISECRLIDQDIVYFKDNPDSINVTKGDQIRILGSKYQGKLIAEKIEKLG
jgi:hypothetical protein